MIDAVTERIIRDRATGMILVRRRHNRVNGTAAELAALVALLIRAAYEAPKGLHDSSPLPRSAWVPSLTDPPEIAAPPPSGGRVFSAFGLTLGSIRSHHVLMSGESTLIGFQCQCGRRTVYVRETMMQMWARQGESVHAVRLRMRCRECGERAPNGPYPLNDGFERTLWVTSDSSISLAWKVDGET
ncbi:hypothetical protein [Ancylobacter pratisalsi]|uniref:Uncharacterized protein n=1 Tax=Ancylobacter pratisalsi TaxID=1745854 RepID=A0A6P1YH80_9HYPH|nr:hypothetical protein [Ancylobacter pratisalsi]QIB32619.1 hypothetical protein G3A50_02055 [Ancylobacter pratisalsi]